MWVDTPRSTCAVLVPLLRGEPVNFEGEDFRVHIDGNTSPPFPIPVLIAALAPRLLRVAGELADGTILWMANARSIETHVAPRINAAAQSAGKPPPRIVAGLPVAVVDDEAEGRRAAAEIFAGYGVLPNYRRILDIGEAEGPADAAIVGDEAVGHRTTPSAVRRRRNRCVGGSVPRRR